MTPAALSHIGATVKARKGRWGLFLLGFVVLYYLSLFATMLIRFGRIPNYVTLYNWPANVWRIFESTPSFADAVAIAREEWLIEVGFMNYNFGHGISEWSVTVWPTKLVLVIAAGALVATIASLLSASSAKSCSTGTRRGALAATGGGAFLVGLSSATLSWVVCCATPTWVVSLALLGMSPGLALALEPFGDGMVLAGYALLIAAALIVARRAVAGAEDAPATARMNRAAFSKG